MKVNFHILLLSAVLLSAAGCSKDPLPLSPKDTRKVVIMYCLGYNNLSSNIQTDVAEMVANAPYGGMSDRYKVIVYSHFSKGDYEWLTKTVPVLLDYYKDSTGRVVADTLRTFPASNGELDVRRVNEVLSLIRDRFPAKEYGFIFSSHGTGWVPTTDFDDDIISWSSAWKERRCPPSYNTDIPHYRKERRPEWMAPGTKTVGEQYSGTLSNHATYTMDMPDFFDAFPDDMHFKYVIMDACLMGGVEEACELVGTADYYIASQTEIMSNGMDYEHILDRLLYGSTTDLEAVCRDYMKFYKDGGNGSPYATVSLVNCNKVENLAFVCRDLFRRYRSELDSVDASKVQIFSRFGWTWFYDLKDILVKAGITSDDEAELDRALASCVEYTDHTDKFITINIDTDCGLSMYLPKMGNDSLNLYYPKLQWNKLTDLVESK